MHPQLAQANDYPSTKALTVWNAMRAMRVTEASLLEVFAHLRQHFTTAISIDYVVEGARYLVEHRFAAGMPEGGIRAACTAVDRATGMRVPVDLVRVNDGKDLAWHPAVAAKHRHLKLISGGRGGGG